MTEWRSAKQMGMVLCHDCRLLLEWPEPAAGQVARCPRCGARLHLRKPNSVMRTWSLVLAALCLYFPANLLPITITTSLGDVQTDTILSGVIYFIKTGSLGVALVIFIASIFIPLAKLLILSYLLLCLQRRTSWRLKDRTRLYRFTEAVGRWSMLDIYVVTILVALVKLGVLANIEAGPAAVYFAAVVVITMLAAVSFDPRLMWDVAEDRHE